MQIPKAKAFPASPAIAFSSMPLCCRCACPCSVATGYMRLFSSSHGLKYLMPWCDGVSIP
eukprot:8275323-Heterocapsa_arctica.AAC.1